MKLRRLASAALLLGVLAVQAPVRAQQHAGDLLQRAAHAELDAELQPALLASRADLQAERQVQRVLYQLLESAGPRQDAFDTWVADSGSGAAHLARARHLTHRAWRARGAAYANKTHPDAFIRMRQLMAAARSDYAVALDKLGKQCDRCHAGLVEVDGALGEREAVAQRIDTALSDLGGGIATPAAYLRFLQPRWGGSEAEMERFTRRFAADFPGSPAVPLLRAQVLVERAETLTRRQEPRRAITLLEEALRLDPESGHAWEQLAAAGQSADDDALVVSATERAIALEPDALYPRTARAHVLMKGPTPLEAVPHLERAVALGSDWALQRLVPIVASGQYGFVPDRARAQAICQRAVEADLPSGYACLGGLHYFGIGRAPDKSRAFDWFAQAADRGVASAMTDAGLMLLRGEGVPADRDRAVAYLIRAHAAGDPRAEGHLRSHLGTAEYVWRVTLPGLHTSLRDRLRDDKQQRDWLIAVFVFLVSTTFGSLLWRGAEGPAVRRPTGWHLQAGWPLRLLAVVNLVVVGACSGWVFSSWSSVDGASLAAMGLLAAGAMYLLYAVFLRRIWFDRHAVYFRSPLTRTRRIFFEDVAKFDWCWHCQSNYVESRRGQRIYFSPMLAGASALCEVLEEQMTGFAPTRPA